MKYIFSIGEINGKFLDENDSEMDSHYQNRLDLPIQMSKETHPR